MGTGGSNLRSRLCSRTASSHVNKAAKVVKGVRIQVAEEIELKLYLVIVRW